MKKFLALAQFRIAKHKQIINKHEEEIKKRKANEEKKKTAINKTKLKNKTTTTQKGETLTPKGRKKNGKTVPIASNPIINYAVATPSSASIPSTIVTATAATPSLALV